MSESPATSPPVLPLQPGRLLVATPSLDDPNFNRTVILVLAYGPEGALGVIVNRPNQVPVQELLPGWDELAAPPSSMFVGGPVARASVICVARLRPESAEGFDGCQPVAGRLATLDLNRRPWEMRDGVEAIRLFTGYAGWESGQLEQELTTGSWFVLPSELDDAFTPDPEGLWRSVLRRAGGRFAFYVNAPPRLSMN